jgi:hypothetical protein
MIKNFYPFAKKRYGFDKPAKIVLSTDTQNSIKPLGKTAHYDPQNYSVTVYTHNRHPKDIMRSVAHELVHHTQNCRGDLSNVVGEQGQGYAQENEHLREMEREAYEQGNLCFRDWEDGIKSNVEPGTIYEKRDKTMGNVNDHFKPRKAALLEKVMDKFGYKVPMEEENGEWYSDEHETLADLKFADAQADEEDEDEEYSDIEGKLTHSPFADQLQEEDIEVKAEDKKYKRDDDEEDEVKEADETKETNEAHEGGEGVHDIFNMPEPEAVEPTGNPKEDALRQIVAQSQAAKVDGVMVDGYTASAIVQVLDALRPDIKEKYLASPIQIMAKLALSQVKENKLKEALRSVFKKNPAFVEIAKKVGVKKLAERLSLRQEDLGSTDQNSDDKEKPNPEGSAKEQGMKSDVVRVAKFMFKHKALGPALEKLKGDQTESAQLLSLIAQELNLDAKGVQTLMARIKQTMSKADSAVKEEYSEDEDEYPEMDPDEFEVSADPAADYDKDYPEMDPDEFKDMKSEGEGDQLEEGDQVKIKKDGSEGVVLEPMVGGAIVELADGERVKVDTEDLTKVEPTIMKQEEIEPLTPEQIDEIARKVAKKLIEGGEHENDDDEEVNEFLSDKIKKNAKKINKKSTDSAETLKSLEKDDDKEEGEEDELKTERHGEDDDDDLKETGASCGGEAAVTLKVDTTDGDEPGDAPGDGLEPVEDNPFGDPLQEWWDIRNNNRTERFFKWATPKKK